MQVKASFYDPANTTLFHDLFLLIPLHFLLFHFSNIAVKCDGSDGEEKYKRINQQVYSMLLMLLEHCMKDNLCHTACK